MLAEVLAGTKRLDELRVRSDVKGVILFAQIPHIGFELVYFGGVVPDNFCSKEGV
jgi:hypothetical protein